VHEVLLVKTGERWAAQLCVTLAGSVGWVCNQRSGLNSASCVFHGPEIPSIIPWVRPAHTHTKNGREKGEGGLPFTYKWPCVVGSLRLCQPSLFTWRDLFSFFLFSFSCRFVCFSTPPFYTHFTCCSSVKCISSLPQFITNTCRDRTQSTRITQRGGSTPKSSRNEVDLARLVPKTSENEMTITFRLRLN
jgi:hypothetical protein